MKARIDAPENILTVGQDFVSLFNNYTITLDRFVTSTADDEELVKSPIITKSQSVSRLWGDRGYVEFGNEDQLPSQGLIAFHNVIYQLCEVGKFLGSTDKPGLPTGTNTGK